MPRPELTLVIPIYNEEEVLPQLDVRLKELLAKLAVDTEVVFVNDGSKDRSIELLRRMASREPRYRVIGFSRNFGHQRAITAGMEKSRGRAVVVMDADLQDPPEVILEMVEKWREGYDVVYGRRRSREGESAFKLLTAKIFYRLFAAMIPIEVPLDTGDFRLMSRRVVQTMRGLRETHRFVRGLVAWVGFKQTAVEYDRAARAAGETKYPLKKMIAFAIDGMASFSIQPLRFATYIGVFVAAASVLYAIVSTLTWFAGMNVPGWTTTVVLVSFLFSVQFCMIGVLGEYVGRIYEQVKRRPLYIVSERINFGRRKVEALVTRDFEVVEPPKFPPAEPSPSRTPPPVKVAGPPALPGGTARSIKAPNTPVSGGPPPKPRSPSIPPPLPATASVPPPKPTTASVPPPKPTTASVPPPKPTASGFVPPRLSTIPPPRPAYASVPPVNVPAAGRTPSAPPVKPASIPPPRPTTKLATSPKTASDVPPPPSSGPPSIAKRRATDPRALFGSPKAPKASAADETSKDEPPKD